MASAAAALIRPDAAQHRQEYGQVEIDVPVFISEILARVRDPSRTYHPPQFVSFQFNSLEFTVGFLQKCRNCGRIGNRVDFKPPPKAESTEKYVCPTCKSTDIASSGQSERVELPLEIVTHGVRITRVFPNVLSRDGKILPEKDQSKQQIPQLKLVSMSHQGVQQAVAPDKYLSPIDGREFDTLDQLAAHLEALEIDSASGTTTTIAVEGAGADPKPRPADRPTVVDTMPGKKERLTEILKRKGEEMEAREAAEAESEDEQAE